MQEIVEWIQERPLLDLLTIALFVLALLLLLLNPINISIILGNSMEPTLSHGDMVVYSEWLNPSEGDIVIFDNAEGYMVSHRIIDKKEPGLYATKGDNNSIQDHTLVDVDKNYNGKVVLHIELSNYINEQFLWRFHPKYDEQNTRMGIANSS